MIIPSIRSAIARRIGGHATEDEARLVALELQVAALARQVEVLTQALQRSGSPAAFPPQPHHRPTARSCAKRGVNARCCTVLIVR